LELCLLPNNSSWSKELHSKGATHLAGQGHRIPGEKIRQIIHLLSSTELTVSEIAERMSCSKGAIAAINRKFQVRLYNGLRSRWLNAPEFSANEDSAGTEGLTKKKSA
jgi:hypothetical protein